MPRCIIVKEENMKNRRPKGVIIFGVLIIVSSLIHIHLLVSQYDWYRENMLTCMPEWLVVVRHCFSLFQRILGLTIAVGILRSKNIFRKLGIALGVFTICTLYWKHPYSAFLRHTNYLDQQFGHLLTAAPGITFSSLALISLIVHYILDIAFWGIFIYYFTRPKVKVQFR